MKFSAGNVALVFPRALFFITLVLVADMVYEAVGSWPLILVGLAVAPLTSLAYVYAFGYLGHFERLPSIGWAMIAGGILVDTVALGSAVRAVRRWWQEHRPAV